MKYLMPALLLTSLVFQENSYSSSSSQDLFGDYAHSSQGSPFTPLRVATPETGGSSPDTTSRTESGSSDSAPSDEILDLISGSFPQQQAAPVVMVAAIAIIPPVAAAHAARPRSPSSSEDDLVSSSQGLLNSPTPLTPRKERLARGMKRLGQSKRTLINLLKAHARRNPGNADLFTNLSKEVGENENSYAIKKEMFLRSLTRAMRDRRAAMPTSAKKIEYDLSMKRLKASITSWEEGCRDIVGEIASSAKALDHQTPALIFAKERRKLLPTGAARRALSDITTLHNSQSQ